MTEKKSEKEAPLTMGEILKQTGLTKKELLAMHGLGLLGGMGQSGQGIRLYNTASLMAIEQILFYGGHDLPLENVREFLAMPGMQEPAVALDAQLMILYTDMDALHTQMAALEAAQKLAQAGKQAPWSALARVLRKELGTRLNFWQEFQSEAATDGLDRFENFDQQWSLYQDWKEMLIRAAIFRAADLETQSLLCKRLGLDWLNWKRRVLAEAPQFEAVFSYLQDTQSWLKDALFVKIADFLNELEKTL
ncbi:MAG: hypothetical protein VB108_11250 [Anaerolineaceae bacterium]|nr:hypothetical protein [Anaerolineaceae bacterium]